VIARMEKSRLKPAPTESPERGQRQPLFGYGRQRDKICKDYTRVSKLNAYGD
jgi:hypothetical protein